MLFCYSGYLDDKVKEGAELLSKLFGGSVDNYYSSSRYCTCNIRLHFLSGDGVWCLSKILNYYYSHNFVTAMEVSVASQLL